MFRIHRFTICLIVVGLIFAATQAAMTPADAATFSRVDTVTAHNGAHFYARNVMPGFRPSFVTSVDCLSLRPALSLCAVDTWTALVGPDKHEGHALVGIAIKNGHYSFRPYKLTPSGPVAL